MPQPEFGKLLREFRKRRRLTQGTLGKMVDRDGSRISNFEKNDGPPKTILMKLAVALELDEDDKKKFFRAANETIPTEEELNEVKSQCPQIIEFKKLSSTEKKKWDNVSDEFVQLMLRELYKEIVQNEKLQNEDKYSILSFIVAICRSIIAHFEQNQDIKFSFSKENIGKSLRIMIREPGYEDPKT